MDRLKLVESEASTDIAGLMSGLGQAARLAQRQLASASDAARSGALRTGARLLRQQSRTILEANARDVADGTRRGLPAAAMDRLVLDEKRIEAMAGSLEVIAALPDPVGRILARFERPNGLVIERVRDSARGSWG